MIAAVRAAAALLLAVMACTEEVRRFAVDGFPGADDRERINAALAAMAAEPGPKVLSFAPRTYRISGAVPPGGRLIGADGLADLRIDGSGAVLEISDALRQVDGYAVHFVDCSRLEVRDLAITWRPRPFVQGRIRAVDQAAGTVDVVLQQGFDDIGQLRRSATAELWCRAVDPADPLVSRPDTPSWLEVRSGADGSPLREALPDGGWRLHAGGFDRARTIAGAYTWRPGDGFIAWQRGAVDAWCFSGGRDLRLSGLLADSALHFACKLRGVSGAIVERCRVVPADGAWFSGSADGIDVQQCVDVVLRGCTVVGNGDDGISFLNHGGGHGWNGTRHERPYPPPLPETNRRVVIEDCTIIGSNRNGILLLADDARVSGTQVVGARQYGLKLTGDRVRILGNRFAGCGSFAPWSHIADELDTGIICTDQWTQHDLMIADNIVEDWMRMPGLQLTSVAGAEIRGNRFRIPGAVPPAGMQPWFPVAPAVSIAEGSFRGRVLGCTGVRFSGNRIEGPWPSLSEAAAIRGNHRDIVGFPTGLELVSGAAR